MDEKDFYTFSEYMRKDENLLTASMEDYLEMIYRLSLNTGFTRIHTLAQALNIQPSSATKMVQHLAHMGLIKYERYGYIMLEESGKAEGARLLNRHMIIEDFIRMIGVDKARVLEETEKAEHMFCVETIQCFHHFVEFMVSHPEFKESYMQYLIRAKTPSEL
jgi:Mn-dependent DtxR family transcriptional regulator